MNAKPEQLTVADLQKAVRQIRDWTDLIDRLLGNMDPHQEIPNPDPPIALKKNIDGSTGVRCLLQHT